MITLSKEEFEQKYGVQEPRQATLSKEDFEKRFGGEKSTLRKIGDFFTGGSQKFGKTLGTAISTVDPTITKQREEATAGGGELFRRAIDMAKNEPDKEKAQKLLESAKNLADTEGVDIFNEPEFQKTAKQIFGEGLETGLEILSFGSFGGASKVPTVLKPLTKGKNILTGAKTGAKFGGAFGAGFGVSKALQEDKSAVDIAKAGLKEGAIGTVGGALLGGGLSGVVSAGAGLTSRASKLVPVIKKNVDKAVHNKLTSVSKDLMKMSPTQTRNEIKWNKNTPEFLVDEGVISLLSSDGKRVVTDEASKALRNKYFAESRAFNNLLTDSGEYVSLDKLKQNAIADLGEKFKARGTDRKKAIKQIEEEITAFKENFRKDGLIDGDDLLVKIADMNRIKTGLWSKTSNFNPAQADKLASDISYRMGQTAKTLIEDTVEDVAVKRMNSRLGDFASALGVLEKANGKVLPGGFFGKAFTRLAGTVAGSGAGIPGSIVGNLTGGMLADIMMNPKYKTLALTKFLNFLRKNNPESQSLINEANEILLKRKATRDTRLLLKEATDIPAGAKTDTSKISTQEEAEQILKELGTLK